MYKKHYTNTQSYNKVKLEQPSNNNTIKPNNNNKKLLSYEEIRKIVLNINDKEDINNQNQNKKENVKKFDIV